MRAAYATREDAEAYGALSLGGVTLPPSRPVADPPRGSVRGAVQLYVDGVAPPGVRETVERMINDFVSVADVARLASDAILRSMDSSPRAQAKARAARFETQLPGLLDAAPKGARDGFGRRQGAGWDAWLRALADVRERVVCGVAPGQHVLTVLAMAYCRWHTRTGIEVEAYRGTPGGEP